MADQMKALETAKQRAETLAKGAQAGKLDEAVGAVIGAGDSKSEGIATLDSVYATIEGDHLTTASATAAMINSGTQSGEPVSGATMDSMLATAHAIGKSDKVAMDGVNSVEGSGILASMVAMHQFVTINSQVGGIVGHIAGGEYAKDTASGALKATIFSLMPMVVKGMGELEDDTPLTATNFQKMMMYAKRFKVLKIEEGVTSYTFNVKAKDSDTGNFPLEHGSTSVTLVGANISIDDFSTKSTEKNPKINAEVNGKQVTLDVQKANGKVTVTVPAGALEVGSTIILETALSSKEKSKIRGTLGIDIIDHQYIASVVTGSVEVDTLEARVLVKQLAYGVLAGGLAVLAQKRIAEIQSFALRGASALATQFRTPINLSVNTGLYTTAEAYKPLTVAIDACAVNILQDSMITENVTVVGGAGLVDAYNMLNKNTDGAEIRDTNDANGVKFLGYMASRHKAILDPMHDEMNPLVDESGEVNADETLNVYHTLYVYGTPTRPDQALIIHDNSLPSLPVDFKIDKDSKKEIAIEGKAVLSINKNALVQKMARKILYKMG